MPSLCQVCQYVNIVANDAWLRRCVNMVRVCGSVLYCDDTWLVSAAGWLWDTQQCFQMIGPKLPLGTATSVAADSVIIHSFFHSFITKWCMDGELHYKMLHF